MWSVPGNVGKLGARAAPGEGPEVAQLPGGPLGFVSLSLTPVAGAELSGTLRAPWPTLQPAQLARRLSQCGAGAGAEQGRAGSQTCPGPAGDLRGSGRSGPGGGVQRGSPRAESRLRSAVWCLVVSMRRQRRRSEREEAAVRYGASRRAQGGFLS